MKKVIIILAIIVVILLTALGLWYITKPEPEEVVDEPEVQEEVKEYTEEEKLALKVDEKMKDMTLREKIGQMLIVSYSGTEYNAELDTLLKDVKPGGFILFSDNISTYQNTTEYIKNVKNTASIPMIIGIDQEGGRVQRIKALADANVITIPSMLEVGRTNDEEISYKVGKILASEIASFGVNLDFAPVLDVFSNPNNTVIGDRAFGVDYQSVVKMSLPFAHGMQEENIIPVYKHFPGHGDTAADSHVELPVVNKTKEELYQNELIPFKNAIDDGAQAIMVAHIALPNVTGNYLPATLSKEVITDILRNELKFDGVVITDAINMGALANNYNLEEICEYSINAGADCLLMPKNPVETVNTIEKLINENRISEEKINEAVTRILKLKYKNKLDEERTLDYNNIGKQENIDVINSI